MNMDRTRIIFVVIIGLALLVVCGGVFYGIINNLSGDGTVEITAVPGTTPIAQNGNGNEQVFTNLDSPEPIWG
ncbi:MAG: hypothetical protein GY796_19530, partial [Chloroflexi bacterium]|nr:hypothetical protein [Chloroflexota bacterium]